MLENKIKRITAGIVAAAMLNGCIAPQQHTWKTESIVSTTYQEVGKGTSNEIRYKISSSITDAGTISLSVKKQNYEVDYNVLQPIQTQEQRQYDYGRSKAVATWVDVGIGTIALGVLLEAVTTRRGRCEEYRREEYGDYGYTMQTSDCISYEYNQGSTAGDIVLTSGILTVGFGSWAYWGIPKKSRPTKNYQTVEVELDTRENKQTGEYILQTVPAISAPLEITSSYFTLNGAGHSVTTKTNVMGNVTVQLSSPNFAFDLDQIAAMDAAQQLNEAGYKLGKYLPLLQEAAVPVSYDVTIKTKATDGKNADVTIPVKGYEISPKALEKVVMGL
ncbi:MAG: hypothetical protein AABX82_03810 [Nanoarchaeota archaeon]